jgi:hypothetical protein
VWNLCLYFGLEEKKENVKKDYVCNLVDFE